MADSFPNNLKINPEVLMNDYVAQIAHHPPGKGGVFSVIFAGTRRAASPMIARLKSTALTVLLSSEKVVKSMPWVSSKTSCMLPIMSSILNFQSLAGMRNLFKNMFAQLWFQGFLGHQVHLPA